MTLATLPATNIGGPANAIPRMSDGTDSPFYEVVDGQYLEPPPMSTRSVVLASRLHGRLDAYAESTKSGQAVMEALFELSAAKRLWRRPDVAYVSESRWPRNRPTPMTDPWPVVPELAVEVVSPSDLAEVLRLKVIDYFRYDVTQVWVVWPQARCVDVYESPTQPRVLTADDTLEGGSLLPGFSLPLREYFREEVAANGAAEAP